MKIDFYTSAFNVIKNNFDYKSAIENWIKISNRISIAINTSEDNTFEAFEELYEKYPKQISIFKTDISYDDPDFDGKIKNLALQDCKTEVVLGLDLDERIPTHLNHRFQLYAECLKDDDTFGCYMLPSIDIYKDINHFSKIGHKWYLHKRNGCYRGTVYFAKNKDGTHDIAKSDSCELIDKHGNLINSRYFPSHNPRINTPNEQLKNILQNHIPYVIHLGYLDLQKRYELNQNFWSKQWEVESGKSQTMDTWEELNSRPIYEHNLKLNI